MPSGPRNTPSARRGRAAALALLALAGFGVHARPARADDTGVDVYAEVRRKFVEAYGLADSLPSGATPDDGAALRAYPLYPYLVAARLQARISDPSAAPGIQEFLQQYRGQPVARPLRARYLMALALARRWDEYLALYDPASDDTVAARCNAFAARIALARTAGLAADVSTQWDYPRSLPDACDPAIDWMREHGELTPQLVDLRARAALASGETGLARYLAKSLPAAMAGPVLQWADLIERPQDTIDALIATPGTAVEPAALLDGWRRYARRNPDGAALDYPKLVAARGMDEQAAGPYALAVGVGLALSRRPGSLPYFARAQAGDYDESAFEWRVRAALWAGDWHIARQAIDAMPESLRSQNRWKYWSARVSDALGDNDAARKGYGEVLPTDNWYAVLSAARLGKPYTPSLVPVGLDDEVMNRLEAEPAFVRARELVACDMEPQAVAEWRYAESSLDRGAQVQAIGIAARWGWYLEAIAAAAKLGIFNDYDLLYPRPYDAAVHRGATLSGLPEDLIYAVIRQESLYQEDARSSAGALGLMQLLPETARRTAKAWDLPRPSRASLLEPSINVPIGSAYLRSLYDRAGGQTPLAIGGYNAGPAAVSRWLPDEPMALDVWVENIPYNETRNYVQKVSWHMLVFGWLEDHRPRDVSSWLGSVKLPPGDTD
jgi:soluble lytic murein transglycosylase